MFEKCSHVDISYSCVKRVWSTRGGKSDYTDSEEKHEGIIVTIEKLGRERNTYILICPLKTA